VKAVSLKLPPGLSARLDRAARERGQSKSAVVRAALEQFLNGERAAGHPRSALDLAGDLVGRAEGPADLSTDPRFLEGYGQ
jgi:hypothetical protein